MDSVEYTSNTVTVFEVGSTGPGGGVVFNDDEAGYDFDTSGTIELDEKNLMDDYRFLEAAPSAKKQLKNSGVVHFDGI